MILHSKIWFDESALLHIGKIILTTGLAGVMGGLFPILVLRAAEAMDTGSLSIRYVLLLPLIVAIFLVTRHISQQQTIVFVETTLERLLLGMATQLRQSSVLELDRLDRSVIAAMLGDIQSVVKAATKSIEALQSLLIILMCGAYLFHLSRMFTLIVMLSYGLMVLVYEVFHKLVTALSHTEAASESALFHVLQQVLSGFDELKMDPRKQEVMWTQELTPLIDAMRIQKTSALFFVSEWYLIFNVVWYLLMGILVFFFAVEYESSQVLRILTIHLYTVTPLMILLAALPYLTAGKAAWQRVQSLLASLKLTSEGLPLSDKSFVPQVTRLRLCDVRFQYPSSGEEPAFQIGPINLTVQAGEIVFIVGGNGVGKTTLLNLLTGLYPPTSGTIYLNERPVKMAEHRALFAAVFAECQLFDQLYGVTEIDPAVVADWLRQMELTDKTSFTGTGFSEQNLSSGQRKRLALIAALLEQKPIYVFDEWAAEQDPAFRQYFYHTLLPLLKAQGKTIVAVTHDEQYFAVADQLFKMEYDDAQPQTNSTSA